MVSPESLCGGEMAGSIGERELIEDELAAVCGGGRVHSGATGSENAGGVAALTGLLHAQQDAARARGNPIIGPDRNYYIGLGPLSALAAALLGQAI